ncbi:DUF3306 domain-containing protein [Ferrimonas lipolytica]|uniref:DUF3306 domain-containing protein n=1 Tax=Ferrimonas lipolytica TaxID=2724191 RepID=A0A6H1UFX9_9GAMM|nr:DUF3306 domain-containing protein [Ferrimonas lipolytica]QIZ78007.1 DUF3306 domain-containing protein [Ferrimonas lipolytica]
MSDLFKRWQKRREEVAVEDKQQQTAAELEQIEQQLAQQKAEELEAVEEQGELEPLPDPDEIEEGGSFADFLKEGVDPLQRQKALKALWSQPQYNVTDGLSEYSLDYAAQPLLDSDVAAELTQKVFRFANEAKEALEKLDEKQRELEQSEPQLLTDSDHDENTEAGESSTPERPTDPTI